MSNKQPEALRLADEIEGSVNNPALYWQGQAAAELRRLHALCEEMGEALEGLERFVREADEEDGSVFDWVAINADEGKTARIALAKWEESK